MSKNNSGLAGKDDSDPGINSVLLVTNDVINAVCSGPLDTSLTDRNMDDIIRIPPPFINFQGMMK